MDIMNVSCSEIQTPAGFLYLILPLIINHINDTDCEQSWLSEDGRLIADPSYPQKLMDPVISVSSDRLVSSLCVNLIHEIICDSAAGTHFRHVSSFRARNETAVTPNSAWNDTDFISRSTPTPEAPESRSCQLWLIALLFIVLLIIVSICFMLRKRTFRDPESVVQTRVRSDDHHSLNQSESEQVNGSVSR